jgi:hypothetical protein
MSNQYSTSTVITYEIFINVVLGGCNMGTDEGHLPVQTEDYIFIELQTINKEICSDDTLLDTLKSACKLLISTVDWK